MKEVTKEVITKKLLTTRVIQLNSTNQNELLEYILFNNSSPHKEIKEKIITILKEGCKDIDISESDNIVVEVDGTELKL